MRELAAGGQGGGGACGENAEIILIEARRRRWRWAAKQRGQARLHGRGH